MNIEFKPVDSTEKPADQTAQGEALKPQDAAKGDQKQSVVSNDDNSWKGRYTALEQQTEQLKAQAENGKFLGGKVLELQDKLKQAESAAAALESEDYKAFIESKSKPKEAEGIVSDEERAQLIEDLGERGANIVIKSMTAQASAFNARLASLSKPDEGLAKRVDSVNDAVKHSEFLSVIEPALRQKVINDNSEFMKWAADQKDGRTSTKAKEIQAILKSRDQDGIGYITAAYAEFDANKSQRKEDAPFNGNQQTQQKAANMPFAGKLNIKYRQA